MHIYTPWKHTFLPCPSGMRPMQITNMYKYANKQIKLAIRLLVCSYIFAIYTYSLPLPEPHTTNQNSNEYRPL